MRVVYSLAAQRDRLRQISYIEQFSYAAADRLDLRIQQHAHLIGHFPQIGKPGRVPGTREFQVKGTDLLIAYRVLVDHVLVVRIVHGAQDWPGRF